MTISIIYAHIVAAWIVSHGNNSIIFPRLSRRNDVRPGRYFETGRRRVYADHKQRRFLVPEPAVKWRETPGRAKIKVHINARRFSDVDFPPAIVVRVSQFVFRNAKIEFYV